MTIEVFTTCPPSEAPGGKAFLDRVGEVSRWTEEAGCAGMLVYTDNSLIDPWLVAQAVLESTERILPLVATQPVYMSPYTAARMVMSTAFLRERRLAINLVTGGSPTHLKALGDETGHDTRYARLTEYAKVMRALLAASRPVSHTGEHYRLKGATLPHRVPEELLPTYYLSGSSPASRQAAAALGVTRLAYPLTPTEYAQPDATGGEWGIRIGVIARSTSSAAWDVALSRFPEDPAGERLHRMTARMSDSQWYAELSSTAAGGGRDPYWLYPFRTYRTFCPYLVGSYDEVGALLRAYLDLGVRTLVLDVPAERADLDHTWTALAAADSSLTPASR
ncbi:MULTISPECIES: LLM class flavin-dependent oxidoreductase [Micromonospora]|uniref:LLM class flavin-dependent oxidoreductase n=1 Tax=Micromonospora TaxID=1873 RepID=UPI001AE86BF4|nr:MULTISPECIES: LLM class flavin-dependent oxidoreductase [unclassified Micromonospora]MBP1780680.1 alkanesulfonate monooxygenase [Micromonospora sp. HB375]MDH6468904.1 alkanesulfonate monooxygenase [Micromonospora sp. H404/HB375]